VLAPFSPQIVARMRGVAALPSSSVQPTESCSENRKTRPDLSLVDLR
jgi:hypothetical protein